jgi:hypothetical protein
MGSKLKRVKVLHTKHFARYDSPLYPPLSPPLFRDGQDLADSGLRGLPAFFDFKIV